jgi:hypothetical protein
MMANEENSASKAGKKAKRPPENEVQPSREVDAAVGLGEAHEGAVLEEYEEELELGEEKEHAKHGS